MRPESYNLLHTLTRVFLVVSIGISIEAQAPQPVEHRNVAGVARIATDPVVLTGLRDEAVLASLVQLPKASPEHRGKGAFALMSKTHWLPTSTFELAVSAKRETTVQVSVPSLLMVRLAWVGSAAPLALRLTKDGASIGTGKVVSVPPDRGTATATITVQSSGRATLEVSNTGPVAVRAELVVGTLPLSERR